ncbi:MAG: hypothetical protein IPN89_16345 [Saprospiraceae bacterium]|nr:hypothetical protein [Saprospiraceae bacterium]
MRILKSVTCIFILLSVSVVMRSQHVSYNITLNLDTISRSVKVTSEITLPKMTSIPTDTIWFFLRANAMSNTSNAFTDDQLKMNRTEYYFRNQLSLAEIDSLTVTSNDKDIPFVFKDEKREIIGIISDGNLPITFNYTLRLPKLIDGLGIRNGNYFLRHFYPVLALYEDNHWTFEPYKQSVNTYDHLAKFVVKMNPLPGWNIYSNGQTGKAGIVAEELSDLTIILININVKVDSGSFLSGNNIVPYTFVYLNSKTPDMAAIGKSLQQASTNLTGQLGKYPYKKLTIIWSDKCSECFMSEGIALINFDTDDDLPERKLFKSLSDVWVRGMFRIKGQKYPWLESGISKYYADEIGSELSETGIREIEEFAFHDNRKLQVSAERGNTFPLNISNNKWSVFDIFFNAKTKGPAFFQYTGIMLGKDVLNRTLQELASKIDFLSPEKLISALEKNAGKDVSFLPKYISTDLASAYVIKDVVGSADGMKVSIQNKSELSLPFMLTLRDNKQDTTHRYFVDGFTGVKDVNIPDMEILTIDLVSVDLEGVLQDSKRSDNHYYPHKSLKHGPLRIKSIFSEGNSLYKELKVIAFPLYNNNDGLMAGATFTNSNFKNPKNLSFAITPAYSFVNKKLLGQAWVRYDHLLKLKAFRKISLHGGIKSWDMNRNKKLDYSLRYVRFDPAVTIHFRQNCVTESRKELTMKAFVINEEFAEFESANVLKGIKNKASLIFRLEYNFNRKSALSSTGFRVSTEQQSYDGEHYIKLSNELKQRIQYAHKKNLYFRVFAAGFIVNTQRQSPSYQNVFTKGSIALIHQGFNDYTYDEYFFSRQNQNGLYDDQTSLINGGGFKTPAGSAYSIGMSNNFAASLNFSADFPIKPKWLPLRLYFDLGTYSTYSNDKFNNNVIYNGGLSLNINDIFSLNCPLFYSAELGNIYKGQHRNFISRLSFSFNLHKLSFWERDKTD